MPWHGLPRRRLPPVLRRGLFILLLAVVLPLAGCGSRSGPAQPAAGPEELPDPCIRTRDGCSPVSEYRAAVETISDDNRLLAHFENRWALRQIKLPEGWANLWLARGEDRPGDGVAVGVLDTGIDLMHSVFQEGAAAGEVTEQFLSSATDETGEEDGFSHGTSVASIIAGRANPRYSYPYTGIAPYVTLKVFAIPLGDPPPPDVPIRPVTLAQLAFYDQEDADTYREVLSQDLDILNLSFGYQGLSENYADVPALRDSIPQTIGALAQRDREDPTILVWAAGNVHERLCRPGSDNCEGDGETDHLDRPAGLLNASSPGVHAGLATHIEELRGHSIAVAATGEDGEIAPFSNRCGIAAEWCIAAPGDDVLVALFGSYRGATFRGYGRGGGTSYAAPMVSGGLALMKQFYRDQLSSGELVTRLFRTADRSGRYAEAEIYGRGFMDLDAALSPVGETAVALGSQVNGPGAALGTTGLQLGHAFGDGLTQSLAGREIAAFDALGAPFWYDLSSLAPLPQTASLSERLRAFQRSPARAPQHPAWDSVRIPLLVPPAGSAGPVLPLRLAVSGTSAADAASHLAFRGQSLVATMPVTAGLAASVATTEGIGDQDPASGAAVSWRAPGALLGIRAGWMGERRGLLGTHPDGAFGSLASDAVFAGIEAEKRLGPWLLRASAEAGSVKARPRGGLFRNLSDIATSGFALRAARPVADGRVIRVSLSQPLRVEDGYARLVLPAGRTKGGEAVQSALAASLEPSGRQMDLAFELQQPLDAGVLRLGATLSRQPGHRRDAEPELILLSGWRFAF